MRIVILGSVALPIPPIAQGGTEWIAYHQARGLAEAGHKVILFGGMGTSKNFEEQQNIEVYEVGKGDVAVGSKSEQKFDPRLTEASRPLRLENVYLSQIIQKLIELKNEYDIILNNMRGEAVFLPIAKMLDKPFVNVMHLPIFEELSKSFQDFGTKIITISNAQRKEFPNLSYIATVYNGIDIQKFPFNDKPEDYLLMMGTIGRHKNQGTAISVAKKLGMKLILAGKIRDKDYFEELKMQIDGKQIKLVGELEFSEKIKLYQNAKAFIFPILWEEPFGLVLIESMSCGTPVIAFNHGAIPEVVMNGKTGFIVQTETEMEEAVLNIDSIMRSDCRKHVENNFTIKKMVDDYEKALSDLSSKL